MLETFETVCAKLGRRPEPSARLYLWRLSRKGLFPSPVQVSPRRIAWKSEEVDKFIASRPVKYPAPADRAEVSR
jgi:predicted DNA-binding transcriptional regulator AlpA